MSVRLADYVIRFLEEAGIGHAFTVCGGGSIFLNDALGRAASIKYVCTHHEQAAAMAAEAYARVRTHLGLAVVTSGPGGTNAITGVAGAWTDHVPTVTLSGQVFSGQTIEGRRGLRTLGVQEINIVDLVRPITKYAICVRDPATIRFHMEQAVYRARAGRPGPVWLDIPADVQNARINPGTQPGFTPEALPPGLRESKAAVVRSAAGLVAGLLKSAERPLLHVGQGVRLAGAEAELDELLERTGIPVVTARNGNDLVDSAHPSYVGRPGTFAQRGANFAVQGADLYIAIGTRLSLAQTGYNARDYARRAKVVMVDVDRAELDKGTCRIDHRVEADAREFLRALLRELAGTSLPAWSPWLERCKAWQAKYPPVTEAQRAQEKHVNSYHLVEAISGLATPEDVIVTDMGFAFQNTHQAWQVKRGQRLMTNCGLAAMGWGLPAAIGAAVGSGRRTICIAGDGGLMMNAQELATVKHHRLPVKLFLLNNGGYLTMRQSQAHAFDGYMGSDEASGLAFPDFKKLAAAHGIAHTHLRYALKVSGAAGAVLQGSGPAFCEVEMDPDQAQAPKSVNRREADGTIRQTAIEDAWPYLPRGELEENLRV